MRESRPSSIKPENPNIPHIRKRCAYALRAHPSNKLTQPDAANRALRITKE